MEKINENLDKLIEDTIYRELINYHGTACQPVLVNGCVCELQNNQTRLKSFIYTLINEALEEREQEIVKLKKELQIADERWKRAENHHKENHETETDICIKSL